MSTREVSRESVDPTPIEYADCGEMAQALEALLAELATAQKEVVPAPNIGAYPTTPIVDPATAALEQEIRNLRQAIEDAGCRHKHH